MLSFFLLCCGGTLLCLACLWLNILASGLIMFLAVFLGADTVFFPVSQKLASLARVFRAVSFPTRGGHKTDVFQSWRMDSSILRGGPQKNDRSFYSRLAPSCHQVAVCRGASNFPDAIDVTLFSFPWLDFPCIAPRLPFQEHCIHCLYTLYYFSYLRQPHLPRPHPASSSSSPPPTTTATDKNTTTPRHEDATARRHNDTKTRP